MSTLAVDLQATLAEIDADSATKLERLVRDAIELARPPNKPELSMIDANGWPVGHFEKYAGSLAGDDWNPPEDPPTEPLTVWC